MQVKDLKTMLEQHQDTNSVYIELNKATLHKLNECQIKSASHNDNLIPITKATLGIKSIILKIE